MSIKKFLFSILFLLSITASCFAQKNPYDNADKDTQIILAEADKLIAEKQYQSAFGKLYQDDNEYIIAKQIEICINYFAKSIMHQMFAFKNLDKNETLNDVRRNSSKFNLMVYDPVKVVSAYTKQYGEKPILNYALGLYYDDVLSHYKGQWLISDDELVQNTITNLQKAYDENCFSDYSLSTLAFSYYRTNKLQAAQTMYERMISEKLDLSTNDYYNLAAIYLRQKNKEKLSTGLLYGIKSIDGYSDYPEFQADAYMMCVLFCLEMRDFKKAKKYLSECK